jgi:hypothetical protein
MESGLALMLQLALVEQALEAEMVMVKPDRVLAPVTYLHLYYCLRHLRHPLYLYMKLVARLQ